MKSVRAWLSRKKYQFEAVTPLAMLEPTEKNAIYIILVLFLLMVMYTTVVYLPAHVTHLITFLFGRN